MSGDSDSERLRVPSPWPARMFASTSTTTSTTTTSTSADEDAVLDDEEQADDEIYDDGGGGDNDDDDDDGENDDEDEEADGFFSLDMNLEIDTSQLSTEPRGAPPPPSPKGNGRIKRTARSSSFAAAHSASPLPSLRRDSKSGATLSPVSGPIAPEIDRRGNLEYKLKILPPSKERFDRLVTQLKWRLLEGSGLAVYEVGVLDDGTLIGLDAASMKDSLKLLSAMAREVGACCEVRRVLALEPRSSSPPPPRISSPSEDIVDQLHTPVDSALQGDGCLSSSDQASGTDVRALDEQEARLLLTPEAPPSGSTAFPEAGRYYFAMTHDDAAAADEEVEEGQEGADGKDLASPVQQALQEAAVAGETAPPCESSDEEGFGFSLSIDGGDDNIGSAPLDGALAAAEPAVVVPPRISAGPVALDMEPIPDAFRLKVAGASGTNGGDRYGAQQPRAALPTWAESPVRSQSADPVLDASASDPAGCPNDARFDSPFAAIDVKGLQTFSLRSSCSSADGTASDMLSLGLIEAPPANRRGRDGRTPFADAELIVAAVTPSEYERLSKMQSKSNVGKKPKRRSKRRGGSGWRIECNDEGDATAASLERRMRRLAELKAAERAGAGWTPAGEAQEAEGGANGSNAGRSQGDWGGSSNSLAQQLVQEMLAQQLCYADLRMAREGSDDERQGDSATAMPSKPRPNQPIDEKAMQPYLTLVDAELQIARDAAGIRELFQRKRREMVEQRQRELLPLSVSPRAQGHSVTEERRGEETRKEKMKKVADSVQKVEARRGTVKRYEEVMASLGIRSERPGERSARSARLVVEVVVRRFEQ
ncbi:hypothetical protein ACQY0O_004801 [Thecaphora frezii]